MPDLTLVPHEPDDVDRDLVVERLVHRRFLGVFLDRAQATTEAEALLERTADRTTVLRVLDGDRPVGRVWTVRQGDDDLAVLDLVLDHREAAPAVRRLVADLARERGLRRLTYGLAPADPVDAAFVAGAGFETSAVQMRLELDDLSDLCNDDVELRPMDQAAYEAFERDEIETYAQARARSGESLERAREVSREQHAELLPDGLASEHQHLFVGVVDGDRVGLLWLGTERPMVFVYDVEVDRAHRRRGHGAALMRAGARWARDRGAHAIGLNVFGYNHGAKALYDRLGYLVTEEFMALPLHAGSDRA